MFSIVSATYAVPILSSVPTKRVWETRVISVSAPYRYGNDGQPSISESLFLTQDFSGSRPKIVKNLATVKLLRKPRLSCSNIVLTRQGDSNIAAMTLRYRHRAGCIFPSRTACSIKRRRRYSYRGLKFTGFPTPVQPIP